jgi:YNFM family putative membrane transporter
VYLAGVLVSPLVGRLAAWVGRRALIAIGLVIASIGMIGTLSPVLPLIVISLVIVCFGNFMAQSTTPAFVNAQAHGAKGGASALYLASFYIGGAAGSVLPGYAWQAWGWVGVVSTCLVLVMIGLLADWLLCA